VLRSVLERHRRLLLDRARVLTQLAGVVDFYIENGVVMPELKTPRIVQVTINVTDLANSIAFYQEAFEASWNEDISSFQFGVWPTDDFFLLSVAHEPNEHGGHTGPTGTSRFGLNVSDLDATHRRALAAGAAEIHAPYQATWKPRSSCLTDPSGNYIDLYEA
jgi:predicted enzyme related to lactoylglutathione lyase